MIKRIAFSAMIGAGAVAAILALLVVLLGSVEFLTWLGIPLVVAGFLPGLTGLFALGFVIAWRGTRAPPVQRSKW